MTILMRALRQLQYAKTGQCSNDIFFYDLSYEEVEGLALLLVELAR